ncbi:MAG TPA: Gfo/Idh/MocA family oxidoreductase [Chloroflexota bacterium]|nr:Gfo/Idh/MocA family oxidoreductase [Chloroflexota bacterium]
MTVPPKVAWAIVGTSDIVERRAADAILQQPDSTVHAVHSRSLPRAQEFARRYGAPVATDDLDTLLADERVDAVYVATEVDRHAEQTIAACNAGKHVLVEKPMALTPEECRAMIEPARKNSVNLAVAYYARFFEKSAAMKRVVDGGHLGRVVRATITQLAYTNPDPTHPKYWRVTGRGGGNLLADVGSHRLDLLMYWLGRPTRVAGLADTLSMPYAAPDTETALVQFASGAHATVLCSANIPRGIRQTAGPSNASGDTSIELYGSEGALLTDPWSDAPVQLLGPKGASFEPITCQRPTNAHGPLMDDFARSIIESRPPRFSPEEALWTTAVIHGAAESAKRGRFVDLSRV